MIHIANATDSIRGDAAKKLIDFCLNNSKYMILARTHKEEIPDLDTLIDSAIARERQYLKDSAAKIDRMDDCELRHETGLRSKSAVLKQMTESTKERIRMIEEYRRLKYEEKDQVVENLTAFGIVKKLISIGSLATFPGIFDLCYFRVSDELMSPLEQDVFSYPISFGGYDFEDAAFEDCQGKVWMTICSRQRSFDMRLTDEKYKLFEGLRICHTII